MSDPTTSPRPAPSDRPWWASPLAWVELFAAGNLAFLAIDIYLAHSVNEFAEPAEWIPFAYSIAAPILLVSAMILQGGPSPIVAGEGPARRRAARRIGIVVGAVGVVVGIAGLVLHLESAFFAEQTIENLVYTAPFVAPLAYAGIGLLLILDRTEDARSLEWSRWVVLLAMGGFIGNFVLALADHAQNGFFNPAEWIGVISAAYAVGGLLAVAMSPGERAAWLLAGALMLAQVAVGLLGFVYHLAANLAGPMPTLWQGLVFGAPIFAPLLYANLAVLGGLGLWAIAQMPAGCPAR